MLSGCDFPHFKIDAGHALLRVQKATDEFTNLSAPQKAGLFLWRWQLSSYG